MGTKDRGHRQKVSSFNPAWCLRPPPTKATTPRNSSNGNKSPLPSHRHRRPHHHRSRHSPELTVEPTSPRVGCMGQIRRCKTSSSAAAGSRNPSSSATSSRSSSASPQFNLARMKKGSNGSVNTSSGSSSASPINTMTGEFSLLMLKRVSSTKVSFEEMDPPRAVERKEAKQREDSVSLWKRRCGGGNGLMLQVQQTEHMCV